MYEKNIYFGFKLVRSTFQRGLVSERERERERNGFIYIVYLKFILYNIYWATYTYVLCTGNQ